MIVMPANASNAIIHYWQGCYGGLGHLYAPDYRHSPYPWLPYVLDNGAYSAFVKKQSFNREAFEGLLRWALSQRFAPQWIVVPDVVTDAMGTLRQWYYWEERLRAVGFKLALAVQDGIRLEDARAAKADIIFVGGSTDWKWSTVEMWCKEFPRVHVGRVNSPKRLYEVHGYGAESCDGTGWFRGSARQLQGLEAFLKWQATPERMDVAALHHAGVAKRGIKPQGNLWEGAQI